MRESVGRCVDCTNGLLPEDGENGRFRIFVAEPAVNDLCVMVISPRNESRPFL